MTNAHLFQLLAEEYSAGGLVDFFQVDIDECPEISTEFGVEVLPSIVLIHHGEILESFIGQKTDRVEEEIRNFFDHKQPANPLEPEDPKGRWLDAVTNSLLIVLSNN